MVNWTALLVLFVLGLIGLWVVYSFLNKNGLYFFCLLAVGVLFFAYQPASVFSEPVTVGAVLMPLVYLAILTCYNKFGAEEAKRLFIVTLTAELMLFIVAFFQAIYNNYYSWQHLGIFFGYLFSFFVACIVSYVIMQKFEFKKLNDCFKIAIYIGVACLVDNIIFVICSLSGSLSFVNILLTFLIRIVFAALISFGLGFFEKFLNRQLIIQKPVQEEQTNQNEEFIVEESNDNKVE